VSERAHVQPRLSGESLEAERVIDKELLSNVLIPGAGSFLIFILAISRL
jgi:hypothetical protein